MRLLLLSNLYPPDVIGGYELLARDLVQIFSARGHDMTVLTTGDGTTCGTIARTLRLVVPFEHSAQRNRLRHGMVGHHNAEATRQWIHQQRPDAVVVMSMRRLGVAPLRVFDGARIPTVLTVNDDWPVAYCEGSGRLGRAGVWLDRALFAGRTWQGLMPKRVIYLSDAVRRTVLAAAAPFPDGIVHPQGIDRRLFWPRPFRPMRSAPRLLFVGRLHPSKAPDVAIDALHAVVQRGLDATLTMAGESYDPAYRAELDARARSLGVTARIAWLGKVSRERLPEVYRDADALLFASRLAHEGQGLTYLEAASSGLPVVAWPSGGAREFLTRYPLARLARTCSGGAFADELLALHADPTLERALVARADAIVRAHASLDAYANAIEAEVSAAIQDVADDGRRAPRQAAEQPCEGTTDPSSFHKRTDETRAFRWSTAFRTTA